MIFLLWSSLWLMEQHAYETFLNSPWLLVMLNHVVRIVTVKNVLASDITSLSNLKLENRNLLYLYLIHCHFLSFFLVLISWVFGEQTAKQTNKETPALFLSLSYRLWNIPDRSRKNVILSVFNVYKYNFLRYSMNVNTYHAWYGVHIVTCCYFLLHLLIKPRLGMVRLNERSGSSKWVES